MKCSPTSARLCEGDCCCCSNLVSGSPRHLSPGAPIRPCCTDLAADVKGWAQLCVLPISVRPISILVLRKNRGPEDRAAAGDSSTLSSACISESLACDCHIVLCASLWPIFALDGVVLECVPPLKTCTCTSRVRLISSRSIQISAAFSTHRTCSKAPRLCAQAGPCCSVVHFRALRCTRIEGLSKAIIPLRLMSQSA